jgi:hypothetical protein
MKKTRTIIYGVVILGLGGGLFAFYQNSYAPRKAKFVKVAERNSDDLMRFAGYGVPRDAKVGSNVSEPDDFPVAPMPEFVEKGMAWLMQSQNADGSWGAGSHAAQGIRDPHAVKADPATTAFCGLAMIRSGATYTEGAYAQNLNKTLRWLLEVVEQTPEDHPNITTMTGTQPQTKLGTQIDVTFTSQFFTRSLNMLNHDPELADRTGEALQKCLRKIEKSQSADGSWTTAGWAPVLQSSMANSALEQADNNGYKVSTSARKSSVDYQAANLGSGGDVRSDAGAGVDLYVVSSTQRSTAQGARKAKETLEKASAEGKVEKNAPVTEDNLVKAGVDRDEARDLVKYTEANEMATQKLQDDALLAGFGNNGGEEYLSYMMTSESMVMSSPEDWAKWREKMAGRLPKIQDSNGSWSGHHCITSPVFCTAAVIMTMTADRDHSYLVTSTKGK